MDHVAAKGISDAQYRRLIEICDIRGGELLSGRFRIGNKIQVRCAVGHTWSPTIYNVLKESWCGDPDCVSRSISEAKVGPILDRQRERVRKAIAARGGEWLDGDYINNRVPIKVRCEHGHEFEVVPSSLLRGTWCARCVGKYPKSEALSLLADLAANKGGKVLSTEYKDTKTKLQFQCGFGHPAWWAAPETVLKMGTWCPRCAPSGLKLDLDDLTEEVMALAKKKGGRLHSIAKVRGNGKYAAEIECQAGHVWTAKVNHLRTGSWCPACNGPGVREKICRAAFEWITGHSFGKKRPSWLRNARGRQMELDGYNPELGIAFEYQGEQHSKHIPFFHREDGEFERRVADDRLKAELCAQHGVILMTIDISIPIDDLQSHLVDRLVKACPDLKCSFNLSPFDTNSIVVGKEQELKRIQEIAHAHGGECLSAQYITNSRKLSFRCAAGHVWDAVPSSIFMGAWCKECMGQRTSATRRAKRDINPYLHIIEQHGGKFLGEVEGLKWKMRVSCSAGHEWVTEPVRLRAGYWCQKCSSLKRGQELKLTIGQLQRIAEGRGGSLLSRRYVRSSTKYLWQCGFDPAHKWLASANSVKRGSWCPTCAGKRKFLFAGDVDEFLRDEQLYPDPN
ncbi:MAG: hypothetical protein RSE16_01025 [Sphingobium sp.]|jgi:hypothetical protein|nr:MAG: hypothetical protein RSE16_01025 [Sphingobium sp.]